MELQGIQNSQNNLEKERNLSDAAASQRKTDRYQMR